MIVRLMGDGQYRLADDAAAELNEWDTQAAAALEAGDEDGLRRLLQEMWNYVKHRGERLADDDLHPSDALVPPDDLSLEEARDLFSGEGLIPDLPAPDLPAPDLPAPSA